MIYSYSSLSLFKDCPYKFYRTYVLKDYKETNKFMDKGIDFHKTIAEHIMHDAPAPAPELTPKDNILDILKQIRVLTNGQFPLVEQKVAVDRQMKSVDYWDKNAVFRGAWDCVPMIKDGEMTIIDWKSGKMWDYSFQGVAYAALGFAIFPEVHTVKVVFDHLKLGRQEPQYLKKKDTDIVWDYINEADATTTFEKKFNDKCKWCKIPSCAFAGKS